MRKLTGTTLPRALAALVLALVVAGCEPPAEEEAPEAPPPDPVEAPEGDPLAELPSDPRGPAGTLPDEAGLEADTVMAARYGAADADSYIGVWAADAQSCALIDGDDIGRFAVITPSGIRDDEGSCTTAPGDDGTAFTFSAVCFEGGTSTDREISVELQEGGSLSYRASAEAEETELVRCGFAP